MAKLVCTVQGDFDDVLNRIVKGVLNASVSATLEDEWDEKTPTSRCSVRVFERYSYAGGNRVSMSLTLFQANGVNHFCAITSGGSQAVFWKVNTLGEEAFMDTLRNVLMEL